MSTPAAEAPPTTKADGGSDPSYAKQKNKLAPFYFEDISMHLTPEFRKVMENYSHVAPDDVVAHIHRVRESLWERRTYPCTGVGMFQVPWVAKSPTYDAVIERLKAGEKLVDIGCYVEHDLRQLVFSGAPMAGLTGVDIVDFRDLGYELFRDQGRFEVRFLSGDVMELDSLKDLKGQMDIVYVGAVLHQYTLERMTEAAMNLVALTKGVGSTIFGNQIGFGHWRENKPASNSPVPGTFGHDQGTWREMWAEVGKRTGTVWDVQVSLCSMESHLWDRKTAAWLAPDAGVLEFVMMRTK